MRRCVGVAFCVVSLVLWMLLEKVNGCCWKFQCLIKSHATLQLCVQPPSFRILLEIFQGENIGSCSSGFMLAVVLVFCHFLKLFSFVRNDILLSNKVSLLLSLVLSLVWFAAPVLAGYISCCV